MRESQYSLWVSTQHANNWNFNPASAPEVSFARECARTTLEYYDRGLEIAEAANVARLYEHAVAFVVPGGIDNLRNFAFEGLPAFEFVSNIGRNLAVDVATCKAGRFVSRMARTSIRSANQARVLSRGGRGNRAQEVRVVRTYNQGRFWERQRYDQNLSRKSGGQTRVDREGFAYKFDPAHKVDKVHLHKYRNVRGDDWKLIEEIDPETGDLISIVRNGKVERWG